MRITLFICGLCVAFFAIILDLQSKVAEAGVGYFILAGSMILASALWRSEGLGEGRYRAMQRVYSALASEPIDMNSLIKRLAGENPNSALEEYYQSIIGRMLSRQQLVIRDGLVTLGDGIGHDS